MLKAGRLYLTQSNDWVKIIGKKDDLFVGEIYSSDPFRITFPLKVGEHHYFTEQGEFCHATFRPKHSSYDLIIKE